MWNTIEPAPLALTEVAVAAHNGRIWAAGGRSSDGSSSDELFAYDPDATLDGRAPPRRFTTWRSSRTAPAWSPRGYEAHGPTAAVRRLDDEAGPDRQRPAASAPAVAPPLHGDRIVFAGGVQPGSVAGEVLPWPTARGPRSGACRKPESTSRQRPTGWNLHLSSEAESAGSAAISGQWISSRAAWSRPWAISRRRAAGSVPSGGRRWAPVSLAANHPAAPTRRSMHRRRRDGPSAAGSGRRPPRRGAAVVDGTAYGSGRPHAWLVHERRYRDAGIAMSAR